MAANAKKMSNGTKIIRRIEMFSFGSNLSVSGPHKSDLYHDLS
jgi:hypothetical protein